MAEEVYTDPSARAAVLGLEGSPENQQIASAIMTQGLSSIMQAEDPGSRHCKTCGRGAQGWNTS